MGFEGYHRWHRDITRRSGFAGGLRCTAADNETDGTRAYAGMAIRLALGSQVGLSLEGTFAGLGDHTTSNPSLTPFPENGPGIYTTFLNRRVMAGALALDLRLSPYAIRPTLHFGLGIAGGIDRYRHILTDTAGTRLEDQSHTRVDPHPLLTAGVSVAFPRLASAFRPSIELRYHSLPTLSDYGWDAIKFVTIGVRLTL